MEYFTSDQHFFHKNILSFEDRPFNTIEEMNEGLVNIWNETVSPNDTVHHLGDFSLGNQDKTIELAEQLNGKIIIYKGNHDEHNKLKRMLREGVIEKYHMLGDYLKRHKFQLWLSHFPLEIGHRPRKFSIHGHTHSHSSESNMLNHVNVGVDSPLNFGREFGKPISLDELIAYLEYINPKLEEKWKAERGVKTGEDS